jgi:hypothetical protein
LPWRISDLTGWPSMGSVLWEGEQPGPSAHACTGGGRRRPYAARGNSVTLSFLRVVLSITLDGRMGNEGGSGAVRKVYRLTPHRAYGTIMPAGIEGLRFTMSASMMSVNRPGRVSSHPSESAPDGAGTRGTFLFPVGAGRADCGLRRLLDFLGGPTQDRLARSQRALSEEAGAAVPSSGQQHLPGIECKRPLQIPTKPELSASPKTLSSRYAVQGGGQA